MSSETISIDRQAIADSFRQWESEQETSDWQIIESLSALEAYQSHLDAWHQDLARERDDIQRAREELHQKREAEEVDRGQLAEVSAELSEARNRITKIQDDLLARTEELRTLERQHDAQHDELEQARSREAQLNETLEAERQAWEVERCQWDEELAKLHSLVTESGGFASPETENEVVSEAVPEVEPAAAPAKEPAAAVSPVLGSVMAQFDKLRQQRAQSRGRRQDTE